jgi:hypothetical protein
MGHTMGIFKEMHEQRTFESDWEYRELRRMLSEAISRGYVEQIPVMKRLNRFSLKREWYRDKETGEIYSLLGPDGKIRGSWDRVEPEELLEPGELTQ